jgi:hypothetical protein
VQWPFTQSYFSHSKSKILSSSLSNAVVYIRINIWLAPDDLFLIRGVEDIQDQIVRLDIVCGSFEPFQSPIWPLVWDAAEA